MPVRIGTYNRTPDNSLGVVTPTPAVPPQVEDVLTTQRDNRFSGYHFEHDTYGNIVNPPSHGWTTQPTIWYRRQLRTFLFDLRAP